MKIKLIILFTFCFAAIGYSQQMPDSLKAKYDKAKTDEDKGECLIKYLSSIPMTDSNNVKNTLELSSWFKQHHDNVGADYADVLIAGLILVKKSDNAAALKICFDVLPHFENRKDNFGIYKTYNVITAAYFAARSYEEAAKYDKMALALMPDTSEAQKLSISKAYNGIGCIYGESGQADSGLVYAQKAVNMDVEFKNIPQLAVSISTLAENYIAAGQYDIALPFLKKSYGYYLTHQAKKNDYLLSYLMNDFAQVFLATQQYDSAVYYAHKALEISMPFDYKDQSMRSYECLYKSFEATKHEDSLNRYFRLAMITKDSLFNIEKTKSIEALGFREQLRQQELTTEKLKAEEERRQNIQYALIALGIVGFITLFLIFSRTLVANERLISFFGILGLLIVFEFINLFIHPWLARFTHESPVLMLLALVLIASLLIPLHHQLEHWIKGKMIDKNKAIRLAAAKKTIEQLEKPQNQ
ncbi:MAG: hypothetical protein ABJA78_06360 [Ferruginibacter sp.]